MKSCNFLVLLACFCILSGGVLAQNSAIPDPSTVPADLQFSQGITKQFHLVTWVTLQNHDGSTEKFQYDRYPNNVLQPGVERVKRSEGVFARPWGKAWVRSDDWGVTGSAVDEKMKAALGFDVSVVACQFQPPTNRDSTQGGTVWRYISSALQGSATDYTFEESREHPKSNVDYPRYTFLKAPGDTDGRLFLCGVTANLRDDVGLIPVSIRLTYLVPVAAGTKVQVFDKDTGKEKLNTITGPNSGWEIPTQSSEPPPGLK